MSAKYRPEQGGVAVRLNTRGFISLSQPQPASRRHPYPAPCPSRRSLRQTEAQGGGPTTATLPGDPAAQGHQLGLTSPPRVNIN